MIAVIQRVSSASVLINQTNEEHIGDGLVILLGVGHEDGQEDVTWLAKKIMNMRIFTDADGKMNDSVLDVSGELLIISQFTLHALTKKGNRPSYINAAPPDIAIPLYESFIKEISSFGLGVKTGSFGADMKVSLTNDGPVTIIIDTKNKQ